MNDSENRVLKEQRFSTGGPIWRSPSYLGSAQPALREVEWASRVLVAVSRRNGLFNQWIGIGANRMRTKANGSLPRLLCRE